MRYEISDSSPDDLRIMVRKLRPEDRVEAAAFGVPIGRFLRRLWTDSSGRRAARIDGQLAAVWGINGGLIDADVEAWLFTADIIEAMPLAFFREGRKEVSGWLEHHRTITTGVLSSYSRSLRFWEMIGFSRNGTYEINGTQFVRLTMGHG